MRDNNKKKIMHNKVTSGDMHEQEVVFIDGKQKKLGQKEKAHGVEINMDFGSSKVTNGAYSRNLLQAGPA